MTAFQMQRQYAKGYARGLDAAVTLLDGQINNFASLIHDAPSDLAPIYSEVMVMLRALRNAVASIPAIPLAPDDRTEVDRS